MKQPNIIFIFSDQQRWDSLGCYGQKLNVTPHLDQMATEGVRFECAFSNQPICTPQRATLQTGKYATETGNFTLGVALPLDEKTLPRYLSEAGYETGYIGKWHLATTREQYADPGKRLGQQEPYLCLDQPVPMERRGGYEDFWHAVDVMEFTSHGYGGFMYDRENRKIEFPEGRYRVDAITDYAIDYVETRTKEKPFFLFLSYLEPHWQNDTSRHESPHGMAEQFSDYEEPGDLVGTEDRVKWLNDGWREQYPHYLACIHNLDHNVGRIRETLEQQGLSDETVIIYSSDHGCHFGSRNIWQKNSGHDASLRVPLLMCGPGFTGGKVVEQLVSLIDLPPTILACAGVDTPPQMKGSPLQPLAEGQTEDWQDEVFFQISPLVIGRGVRTKKWKYAVKAPGKQGFVESASDVYEEDFLYDLEQDPHERTNLVGEAEYGEVRAKLAALLKHRMTYAGERVPEIIPTAAESQ